MQSSKTFVMVDRPFWKDKDPNTGRDVMSTTLTDRLTRGTYLFDNGDDRPAVICLTYSWMSDAMKMLPHTVEHRVRLALSGAQEDLPRRRHRQPHRRRPDHRLLGGRRALPRRVQGCPARALPIQPPDVLALHAGRLPAHQRGIFLAGDDISWTPAWVEGAVQTALNAVWGIMRHFGGRPIRTIRVLATCSPVSGQSNCPTELRRGGRMTDVTGELTAGERTRGFALRLPRGASGGMPLVIVLHGNHPDATGQMMRDWTTFDAQADAFGFAVAYPDGVGGCWADGRGVTTADEAGVDDVAFLRALVDTSAERHGTHPDRAVVAGVSNGAFMAHRMALEASEKVAVFAAVAGGLPASLRDVRPAHAVSAMLIHGTADPVPPIQGGYSRHRGPQRGSARPDPVAGRDGGVLARRRPLPARSRRHAHHRVLEPERGRRRRRRDAGHRLDGVRGRPHLARRQAVSRGRRDRVCGVRRRRGDLPLRRAPARGRGQPAAITRRALCAVLIVLGPRCRAAAIVATAKAAESGPGCPFPPAPPRVLKVARVPEHNWRMTVLYHADVIGSLLRPRYLSEARAALTAGRMSNTEFKRIEDRAVDQAIAMQEGCGLDVVNDGELRRFSFLDHLLG